eukprot:1159152-Pelagomonas_calceolata.AAC.1
MHLPAFCSSQCCITGKYVTLRGLFAAPCPYHPSRPNVGSMFGTQGKADFQTLKRCWEGRGSLGSGHLWGSHDLVQVRLVQVLFKGTTVVVHSTTVCRSAHLPSNISWHQSGWASEGFPLVEPWLPEHTIPCSGSMLKH